MASDRTKPVSFSRLLSAGMGGVDLIRCSNCGKSCPKDKAIERFLVRNIVEQGAIGDVQETWRLCCFGTNGYASVEYDEFYRLVYNYDGQYTVKRVVCSRIIYALLHPYHDYYARRAFKFLFVEHLMYSFWRLVVPSLALSVDDMGRPGQGPRP